MFKTRIPTIHLLKFQTAKIDTIESAYIDGLQANRMLNLVDQGDAAVGTEAVSGHFVSEIVAGQMFGAVDSDGALGRVEPEVRIL